jgi:hypothetical protein
VWITCDWTRTKSLSAPNPAATFTFDVALDFSPGDIERRQLSLSTSSSCFFSDLIANDRQPILVGVESFFPIQALQEFSGGLADRRGH